MSALFQGSKASRIKRKRRGTHNNMTSQLISPRPLGHCWWICPQTRHCFWYWAANLLVMMKFRFPPLAFSHPWRTLRKPKQNYSPPDRHAYTGDPGPASKQELLDPEEASCLAWGEQNAACRREMEDIYKPGHY